MRGNRVWMATGNRHKYMEARKVLAELGIELERMDVERVEIQSDDLAEIATYSLARIEDDGRTVVAEDAGIFIDHLKGFPGPYSSYALRTIGLPGVLKLMEGVDDRKAYFQSAVAYKHKGESRCFKGVVKGLLARSVRGTGGFGYDPIFIPVEGDGETFGEMTAEEKNSLSHRARAFRSFGEWLVANE